eukprot:CAMPEP_0173421886 /NCGR_PEP_ID=MMETSP1357-20121228/2816_1 /TAXON_ID=77926 /ORGANISM="Hemiselmis rufescens, Strain PCC563" /LENGTH=115 /DNA_ID=CAMNT_0014384847 /DNA_START=442 /DNA_END=786 /DNA_ORIENTATION=+
MSPLSKPAPSCPAGESGATVHTDRRMSGSYKGLKTIPTPHFVGVPFGTIPAVDPERLAPTGGGRGGGSSPGEGEEAGILEILITPVPSDTALPPCGGLTGLEWSYAGVLTPFGPN